ncbi:MAG: alkaline phosphatase [Chthoniobacterales bacterium]
MKWRNRLLAVFCLLVFAALGVLYFKHWVVQKPFGIILFVGEGLTPARIAVTRVYVGGADAHLALESMPNVALLKNCSNDFAAPDQAAAATALATGMRVNNRTVGVDTNGKALASLLDLARTRGRLTGLVTDGRLTDPTSAAFYAHLADSDNAESIARDFVDGGKIDVAMGGGTSAFVPKTKGGERQDDRDLLLELRRSGFEIVRTRAELEAVSTFRRPKLFGAFANAELAFFNQIEQRSNQPSLADMVRRAIEMLQYNPGGYLLVADAGLMRKGAQENNAERTLGETVELDRAIGTAQRYAGVRSTIIVCGDVAIGGLALNGFPFRHDSGIALLGLNPTGEPWITWATGPKGKRSINLSGWALSNRRRNIRAAKPDAEYLEPVAVYADSALHTVEDMAALGTGPGSARLHGYIDNTQVFQIIRDEL